jgi:hypothetical protein
MLRRLALMALGAAYYTACVLRRGVYRGHQRFYARAQDGTGLLGAATRAVLTSAPTQLVRDWNNLQSSIDRDRISPMAAADYNDDTLAGYADRYYTPDSAEVPKQQRAAALPLIEQAAGTLSDGSTLVEIGAASGDVSAYVASEFPALQVVGVDLSVAAAETRYDLPNLTFRRGYALDMLEAGEIDAELVFAASTFILFTPLELARYCRALAAPPGRHGDPVRTDLERISGLRGRTAFLSSPRTIGVAPQLRRLPDRCRLPDHPLGLRSVPTPWISPAGHPDHAAGGAAVRRRLPSLRPASRRCRRRCIRSPRASTTPRAR